METRREFLARSGSLVAGVAGLSGLPGRCVPARPTLANLGREAARVRRELRLFADEYLPVLLAPRLLDHSRQPPQMVSWPGDHPALRPGPVVDSLLCRAALLPRWRSAVRRLAQAVPSGPGAAPARPNGEELCEVLAATGPEEALLDEPEQPCYRVVGGRIEWPVHPYHLWGPGESEDQARRVLARVPFADAKAPDARRELLRQLSRIERWASQVQLVHSRVLRVIELAGLKTLADISPARVQAAIAHLRQQEDRSIQTCNFYLQAIKQLCRWLVREQRLESNPIAHLQRGNVRLDRRHDRRDLTTDEVAALLAAARSGPAMRGLSGPDRALLYTLALYTGLRASELASLTTASLCLDGETPSVIVAAAYSKHRREDRLPLHADLVAPLRACLAGREAGARLWPGQWAKGKEAGVMLRADLERAGVPYKTDAGYADFHALRHSFISNLVRGGANPRVAMALARHSTIELTMNRYAHVLPSETVRALGTLPSLPKQVGQDSGRKDGGESAD